jgi:hypothetical protein
MYDKTQKMPIATFSKFIPRGRIHPSGQIYP